jgi:hypothetical protein
MDIPDSELQKALREYQEWGPRLRTPREVRIAALLPHRNADEITQIINICKSVEADAWNIATAVRDHGLSQKEGLKQLRERFPFMSPDNLSTTFNQAMYSTLK